MSSRATRLKAGSREIPREPKKTSGLIILFGSGEMSPTGRKIHEDIIKRVGLVEPIHIGILETPTGFEVNAMHSWPARMQEFFEKGLKNYKPLVTRIRAWRRDGEHSTNDSSIVDTIFDQDYLYCGAGSPGYAVKHLKDTLAYDNIIKAHKQGSILCLGSATAVALSHFTLPVYEIFKAGEDLHWIQGLNFFVQYGLDLTIVPHWNNREGEDFDTTRCWMGQKRFEILKQMLPPTTTILGIDEQTACVVDIERKIVEVLGVGAVIVMQSKKEPVIHRAGSTFALSEFGIGGK